MSTCELKDIDPEDIDDILIRIEESFDTKFPYNAFENVMTFGDLVSAIEKNLASEHINNCTTQQAFYKVRKALNKMNFKQEVKLDLELSIVFPKRGRRTRIKEFVGHLGIDVSILEPHKYLVNTNLLVLLSGVIFLFFYPLIGVGIIGLSIFSLRVMNILGTELRVRNIRELTELLMNEKYGLSRSSDTINRKELWGVVESYFRPYDLTEKLTPDTKFEWAK
ncbi:MAG: hypothetical protein OEX22_09930 [Cyclobacteriaceae bacterium]|nr:hypothetical protein [Cyclobacteriaceae bacterium]